MHCATTTYTLYLASDDFFLFPIALAWTRVPGKRNSPKKKQQQQQRWQKSHEKAHMLLAVLCPLAACVMVQGVTQKAVHSKHRSQNSCG